jgi:hypothetical protein
MPKRVGKVHANVNRPIMLNSPKNSTSRLVDLSEKLKESCITGTTLSSMSRGSLEQWRATVRIVTGILFLVCLSGSAWASLAVPVPAPEIDAGILGMSAAAGVIYLLQRRKRS